MRSSIMALAAIVVLALAARVADAAFIESGAYYIQLVAERGCNGGDQVIDYLGFLNQTCKSGTGDVGPYDTQKTAGPVVRTTGKQWRKWIITKTGSASNGDDLVTFKSKAPKDARCSGFMVPEKRIKCDDKRTHIHPKSPYIWRLVLVPNTDSYEIIAEGRSPKCLRFLGADRDCKNKFTSLVVADDGSGYQRWRLTPVNPLPAAEIKIATDENSPTSAMVEITNNASIIPAEYVCTYQTGSATPVIISVPYAGPVTNLPLTDLVPNSPYTVACVGVNEDGATVLESPPDEFTSLPGKVPPQTPGLGAAATGPNNAGVGIIAPDGSNPAQWACTYTSGGSLMSIVVPATNPKTTFPLSGLLPGTAYTVSCTGLDGDGAAVTATGEAGFTTPAKKPAGIPGVGAKPTGPNTADVLLTDPEGTTPASYKCTYSSANGSPKVITVPSTNPTTLPLTGLTPATLYTVTCTGLDAAGEPVTEPASTTFTTPSGPAPGIVAKPTGPTTGNVTLTAPPGINNIDKYICTYYAALSGAPEMVTVPSTGTSTVLPLTDLTPSTTYSGTCTGLDASGLPVTGPSTGSFTTPPAASSPSPALSPSPAASPSLSPSLSPPVIPSPSPSASPPPAPVPVPVVPSPPTDVTASATEDGCATVTWKPPASNGGLPITGYNVTCVSPGGADVGPAFYPGATTTTTVGGATLCGMAADVPYTCTVEAVNGVGPSVPGGPSDPISTCPAFQPTRCDGICVDTQSSLMNCGACGNVCTGAIPSCVQGVCYELPGAAIDIELGTVTDSASTLEWTNAEPDDEYVIHCVPGESNTACYSPGINSPYIPSDPSGTTSGTITGLPAASIQTCYVFSFIPQGGTCSDNGLVVTTCATGEFTCDGVCIDPTSNDQHCSTCGNVCPGDTSCVDSACICATQGETLCGTSCLDLLTDSNNCGACGEVCPGASTCSGGTCVCPAGQTLCSGVCVQTSTDTNNCGGCGNICPVSSTCTAGVCGAGACGPTETSCSGICKDLANDELNCGSCGFACPNIGDFCNTGLCGCPAGTQLCGNTCVDIQTDNLNCGSCGNACPFGNCVSGTCPCPPGQELCGGVCVDKQTDIYNCGSCGNFCGSGVPCVAGACPAVRGYTFNQPCAVNPPPGVYPCTGPNNDQCEPSMTCVKWGPNCQTATKCVDNAGRPKMCVYSASLSNYVCY